MGSWDYGPFDNDDAANLIAQMMKPIRTVVSRKTDRSASYHYSAARCAAQVILLANGTDILGGPDLDVVLRALKRMRGDRRWLDTWSDPKEIESRLAREIASVKRAQRKERS